MSIQAYEDDPILTAYALGELDDDEARAVEARLADDPAAREYVESIRRTAERLSSALHKEPALPAAEASRRMARRAGSRWRLALAAAAALAAVGITTSIMLPSLNRSRGSLDGLAYHAETAPEATGVTGTRGAAGGYADSFDKQGELELDRAAGQPAPALRAEGIELNSGLVQRREQQLQQHLYAITPATPADADARARTMSANRPPAGATPAPAGDWAAYGGRASADDLAFTRRALQAAPPEQALLGEAKDADGDGIGDRGLLRLETEFNTEQYDRIVDNPFTRVGDHPLSTFGVDVDTASYANVRRFLNAGQLPPPDAVRIEELVNYFDYAYEPPASEAQQPFAARVAVAVAPWNPEHRLVRIGIKGKEIKAAERPVSNLVFLLDVSGSMNEPNKLPLVRQAMSMLAQQLDERDRVAIVVYAGSSGMVLPSTSGNQRELILAAINQLTPGGSTNGAEGIQLAYQTARQNFVKGGVNRVILCTDGDFNVGVTDRGQLTRLIEEQARSGVYLSILGFGMGNLKDATMEELSNKGEGNYGYVDTEHEARKLLVEQMSGTLVSIAKDVKIQVEFNPAVVGSYRLIGYENRILAKEDFNDDTKDAGDIGAGHEVTALYEVVPVGVDAKNTQAEIERLREILKKYEEIQAVAGQTPDGKAPHEAEAKAIRERIAQLQGAQPRPAVDELKYQEKPQPAPGAAASGELLTVKLRYKAPEAPKEQGTSTLIEFPVKDEAVPFAQADADLQHAAAVAGFGMMLRNSPHRGALTWAALEQMTRPLDALRAARPPEPSQARKAEFRELLLRAAALSGQPAPPVEPQPMPAR